MWGCFNKPDIFTIFGKVYRYLCTVLKDAEDTETLKAELSQLAKSYYSNYKPSTQTLKKHGILKKLGGKKDIVHSSRQGKRSSDYESKRL